MKKTVLVFLASLLLSKGAWAQESIVVWGGDLTANQKEIVRQEFLSGNARLDDAQELVVTNREEREALAGKVDPAAIGSRSISSVYIEVGRGRGIDVKTRNISLITPQMYRSALLTGGVRQAKVIAAAPVPVSGTAALTGIFKAYERITGEELSSEAKDAATEELVQAGELGQTIGQEKAAQLMENIKEQVLKQKPKTLGQVEEIVRQAAQKLNVSLSRKQLRQLSQLFLRIGKLPLNLDHFKQLVSNKNFWSKIGAWLAELGAILVSVWHKLVAMF
jgi:uncharacterized protein YpuA (DUF1002 family)